MSYPDLYRRSIDEPEAFWREQAQRIHWHQPFTQVCDTSQPPFARWFVGGRPTCATTPWTAMCLCGPTSRRWFMSPPKPTPNAP